MCVPGALFNHGLKTAIKNALQPEGILVSATCGYNYEHYERDRLC